MLRINNTLVEAQSGVHRLRHVSGLGNLPVMRTGL